DCLLSVRPCIIGVINCLIRKFWIADLPPPTCKRPNRVNKFMRPSIFEHETVYLCLYAAPQHCRLATSGKNKNPARRQPSAQLNYCVQPVVVWHGDLNDSDIRSQSNRSRDDGIPSSDSCHDVDVALESKECDKCLP